MAQSQKYMAYIVPLFALSGLYWAFGLVMYWVTTNIWTLGQQYVLFKRYPMPTAATAGAPAAAASGKAIPSGKTPVPGKPAPGKAEPASKKAVSADKTPGTSKPKPAIASGKPVTDAAGGQGSSNGSGMLRRLTKGRSEPEPQDAVPETKLVRQQRVRQSRSKRSGKR
jgi:YidC/Oxa1 family membrane protein insertase